MGKRGCVLPQASVVTCLECGECDGIRTLLTDLPQVFDWETTWKAGTTHDHWAASWLACSARDKQVRRKKVKENTSCQIPGFFEIELVL